MTAVRSEETLVGIIALAAAGWIVWILVRAVRDSRLPIGKSEVLRAQRPGAFGTLFALYGVAAVAMCIISLDLLTGIDFR
jgi:hypothetical protein